MDGVLILIAGAVLITPGILTDLFGFLCLVPACRRRLKRYVTSRLQRSVREGTVNVTGASGGMRGQAPRAPMEKMKNVTPPRAGSQSTGP